MYFLYRIETNHSAFYVDAPNESEARGIAESELMFDNERIERVICEAMLANK
jgi:hypothetical protein